MLLQAAPAITVHLSSILQCKTFLANALELLASLMQETPAICGASVPTAVSDDTVDLIAHGGFTVSALPPHEHFAIPASGGSPHLQ